MNGFSDIDMRLMNDYQHDFPLVRRPFRKIGEHLGMPEHDVIDRLAKLTDSGAISRIGPVFSPGCIGASTLAALALPAQRLEEVAQWLNGFAEINHNYEREHIYNLWFVVAAPTQSRLDELLQEISLYAACPMLVLPLEERFHIDLGFDLNGKKPHAKRHAGKSSPVELSGMQSAIVAALQAGIPCEPEPFAAAGARARMDEDAILDQIISWRAQGVIKRFGVVVRHHELGYSENAMVVWDVPDDRVSDIGKRVAQLDSVTLCYRRPRQLPGWPYNLFCMVHGTDRSLVLTQIGEITHQAGLDAFPFQLLFSRRRFKQHGARYVTAANHEQY